LAKDVSIFISATCRDLEAEGLRTAVIKAIDYAKVEPVTMETWEADYRSAAELCRERLATSSTHYVGVFAYYRGFVPAGEPCSITEMEYQLARDCRPATSIAIFLPREPSAIEERLRKCADELKQSAVDAAAQGEFLKRVRSAGVIEAFESEADLALRVNRKARSWAGGGLRGLSAATPAPATPAVAVRRPRESDFASLGFDVQEARLKNVLADISLAGGADIACFLLYGAPGAGQTHLLRRLLRTLEASATAPPRRALAGIGPLWRQDGPGQLALTLSRALGREPPHETVAALGAQLAELLAEQDVVLEITAAQRYPGEIPGLAASFWQPLVAAVGTPAKRLVCMVTMDRATLDPAWSDVLHADAPGAQPARIVPLAPLGALDVKALALWLKQWLDTADAKQLAITLMAETQGTPHLLYAALLDDTTWNR
jgi:hypothetical protein